MASLAGGSSSTDIFLSRKFLYEKMNESGHSKLEEKVLFLTKYLEKRTRCPKLKLAELHNKISYFVSDFKKRWSSSQRMKHRFLDRNTAWLEKSINFRNYEECINTEISKKKGRPNIDFKAASERTKRLKTQDLRSTRNTAELCYAAQMSLRSSGATDAATIVKEVTQTSPKRATRYKAAYKKSTDRQITQLSAEEALSTFIDAQVTRHQYNIFRNKDKERFPSYKIIQKAKKNCYPDRQFISITDLSAEINLQALLDHTASRVMQSQKIVFEDQNDVFELLLIYKWRFDGSSGHSEYKQTFASGVASDASIFLSSVVPLRLISGDPEGPVKEQVVYWSNPRPSSTRYCRPIKFQFAHETTELAKKEHDHINTQILNLIPTAYEINGRSIVIRHKLLFTMVDGKICNALTDTSSTMKCYLCGLTSKKFNNISKCVEATVDESRLQFGMSTLHAWIRFFECLLKVAYKLPIKTWQARGKENQKIVDANKKRICEEFKSELGLIIDKPKPGYGSSNDGNTARRFFENADISARITGIDIDIIKRFRTILKAIASGFDINVNRFKAYALETTYLFVEKYSWYSMPPTIHKVLIHGPIIIENALLPIGQLSEEAQEANNKMFKRYRERFSRKSSREKTNADILYRLLISSDPLISSMHQPIKRKSSFDPDTIQLLDCPDLNTSTSAASSTDEVTYTEDSDEESTDCSEG